MWYKRYIDKKYNWVRNNPILSAWIGFIKGVIYTILVYELLIGCTANVDYEVGYVTTGNPDNSYLDSCKTYCCGD